MKKELLFFALLFIGLLFKQKAFAQKHADLLFHVISPSNGEVIPYGDTAYLRFSVTNLGPDNVDSTTPLYIDEVNGFSSRVITPNIAVGDSAIDIYLISFSNTPANDTFSSCLYLNKSLNTGIVDNNQTNDTACVAFILEGSTAGILSFKEKSIEKVKLYPNPAMDVVRLFISLSQPGIVNLSVKNILGRTVLQHNYGWLSQSKTLKLDVSSLKEGIYFVEMAVGQQRVIKKLVIL